VDAGNAISGVETMPADWNPAEMLVEECSANRESSSCYFHLDEEISHFFDHGPVYEHRYVTTAPLCTESEKRWQETLDGAPPPPAAAKFNAAERQALAITVFDYLCELTTRVGWRQSASKEEVKAAGFLIDRFTKFGYSPETQDFHVRIGPLWRKYGLPC